MICERGALALTVMLDSQGKAAGLLINPVNTPVDGGGQGQINKWKSNPSNAGLVIGKLANGKVDIQNLGLATRKQRRNSILKPFSRSVQFQNRSPGSSCIC